MGQEASILLRDIIRRILEIQVPLSLFPLVTWIIAGPAVCSKSKSKGVRLKAILLSLAGIGGIIWLHLIPWLYFVKILQPSDPSLKALIELTVAIKSATTKLTGDSVIWALSFEIGAIGVLVSFTKTDQKWAQTLTKWLWVAFIVLAILAVILSVGV